MPQQHHALLVTDVVDSTGLAEKLGDAKVAALWAAHDRLARDLLQAHRGREIDKTDGFLLLFESATDALGYALGYHAALEDLGLRARAGLHVGGVVLRANTADDVALGAKPLEVEGLAKSMAARVMSLAQGGQTLATIDAIDALDVKRAAHEPDGRMRGDGLLAVTHGHWMLKGVLHPLELFELGVQGEAPFVPPPDAPKAWRVQWKNEAWVPAREVKHSLPRERDAFIGREEDLHALAELLDEGAALVSVLGVGGTGKTRLVTHFGWTWLGSFPGGVWFCDLSEARSADGIAYAVAQALDVQLGRDPTPQLGHAIAGHGHCLVILDNFEQVTRHAQETLGKWLDRARDARFVVTTREILGLRGEKALALAPLPSSDAAKLFLDRAKAAKRDFRLSVEDEPSVHELVRLLDGLPLAIELAAARVRVMAPKTLLARMSQRFKLLSSTGGRRDRQATLRAALDWSWDLLAADERTALGQLSVFEGGFTLEAAAAVLDLAELWPEDAAQALVDKSLVRASSDERLDLLVSVKEYAAEHLDAAGGREAAEARHGAYYAGLGTAAALAALDGHGGAARRRRLARELDNLVMATRRAVARRDEETMIATLQAAWALLQLRGPLVVALDMATAVLGATGDAPDAHRTAQRVLGQTLQGLGRGAEARAHYERCLAGAREAGDRRAESLLLGHLGTLAMNESRMEAARTHYDEALSLARAFGDRGREGGLLNNLGMLEASQSRPDEARAYYGEALEACREVGHRRFEGNVLGNLGNLHKSQGEYAEARKHYEEVLALARELGYRGSEATCLLNLGTLNLSEGRPEEACTQFTRSLEIASEVGDRTLEGTARGNLGSALQSLGRPSDARAKLEEGLAIHRETGNRRSEGAVLGSLGIVHAELGQLDGARAAFDAGEALLRDVDDARMLGKLLCGRVQLELAGTDAAAAEDTLQAAQALAARIGAGPDSDLGVEIAKARADVARTR